MTNKDKYKEDKINLTNQYNNYIYPKPYETLENNYINYDPKIFWNRLWPEKKFKEKDLKILVAGCGSNQASVLAYNNPNHHFVGIDISNQSIKNNEKLITKYKLKNLELICDDFRLIKFKYKFHLIFSSGVIHHLKDPLTALIYLESILTDDGVIALMVYGKYERYAINQVKTIFKKLNLNQDNNSINFAKKIINNLNQKHPSKIAEGSKDYKYDAGFVDLLLHNQEKFYEINDLISELKKSKLIIKGVYEDNLRHLTKFFTFDINLLNKIRSISPDEKLQLAQILNWKDSKIELIVCKESNFKYSTHYQNLNLKEIYIKFSIDKKYKINENIINIETLSKNIININFDKIYDTNFLNTLFKGDQKIFNLIDNKNDLQNIIIFLLENALIDYSFHPF